MAKPCIRILRALLQPGAPRQPQGRLPHALPTLAAAPPCRRPAHLSRARGEPCARFLVIARGVAEEPRPTDARCRAALPASGATSRARGEPRARFCRGKQCRRSPGARLGAHGEPSEVCGASCCIRGARTVLARRSTGSVASRVAPRALSAFAASSSFPQKHGPSTRMPPFSRSQNSRVSVRPERFA
ncbi:unnamed protein product, partial [Prorocentrum cordatum]